MGVKPCKSGYPQNPQTLGEHIRKVRMDRNLWQRDVAKVIGVTESCIMNWENNRATPQISHTPEIIAFLGFTPKMDKALGTWGNQLLQYRQEHGLTQRELAKTIGIDDRTLGKIEKGDGRFFNKTKEKIRQFIESI